MVLVLFAALFVIEAVTVVSAAGHAADPARRSGWARAALVASCVALVAALALLAYALSLPAGPRLPIHYRLDAWVLPLAGAWPPAITVLVARGAMRAGWAPARARHVAIGGGLLALVTMPFLAIATGCGLAGACF